MIELTEYSKLKICNLELIQNGVANTSYKADSTLGKIIVRIGKIKEEKDPYFEANLLHFLNQKKINVPKILFNDFGNLYSKQKDGAFITVFSFIEGNTLDNSIITRKKYAVEAGLSLAKFHNTTKTFSKKNDKRTLDSEILLGLKQKEKFFKLFSEEAEEFIHYLNVASNISKRKYSKELLSILHNDFRPQNLILDKKQSLFIIDFDWAIPGPIQKDISLALMEWSRSDDENEFNFQIMENFLKGYNKVSSLNISFDQDMKDWMFFNAMSDASSFVLYKINMNKPVSPKKSFMYQKALDILRL